jgi:hypothetical protein
MFENLAAPPLTTWEGLEHAYIHMVRKPDLPSPDEYRALSDDAKNELDEARLRYVHRGLDVATPAYQVASARLGKMIVQNLSTVHDKQIMGISGKPYSGKSHLLHSLVFATMKRFQREVPDFIDQKLRPCVMITVPAPITTKGVLIELATFFGYPTRLRYTEAMLRQIVTDALREHRTVLLCIDEAQNMASGRSTAEDAKNLLRKLTLELRCTPLYSGIDLRDSGLLGDTSGKQLTERLQIIDLHPYSGASQSSRALWRTTVASFEQGLCLIGHVPGSLDELAPLLFNLTGGVMGELSYILRSAAISLITSGTQGHEQITEAVIRSIPLSEAALERLRALGGDDEFDWPANAE